MTATSELCGGCATRMFLERERDENRVPSAGPSIGIALPQLAHGTIEKRFVNHSDATLPSSWSATTMLRVITSGRIAGTKIDTASDLAELNLRARLAEDRLAGLEAALNDLRAQRDDLITQ